MEHLERIRNQIKDKYFSDMLEGVVRFPSPILAHKKEAIIGSAMNSPSIISKCKTCALSQGRKRVVVEKNFQSRSFFVLSDFPDKFDENSNDVYSEESPLSLICLNLLKKLEIEKFCHFSFAIKCLPEKGTDENSLEICANKNLATEILEVAPKIILCFGYRALHSLLLLDSSLKSHNFVENSECLVFSIEKLSIRLFFLSSLKDLKDYPLWRKQVWSVLAPLSKNSALFS